MLNNDRKKQALEIHQKAIEKYNATYEKLQDSGNRLYAKRKECITQVTTIEAFINSIANTPKEFKKNLIDIKAEYDKFTATDAYAEKAYQATLKSGIGAAVGVAGGATIASMAPNAMLWVATTFGTASTGTAISTLSGAAATKAASAWLGRTVLPQFLVAGAGMKAGEALLVLTGPIGWSITGVSVVASSAITSRKNKKVADEAIEEAKQITTFGAQLHETAATIDYLFEETKLLQTKLTHQFEECKPFRGTNFSSLSEEDQLRLGTLVNNTLSLAELLNKIVE